MSFVFVRLYKYEKYKSVDLGDQQHQKVLQIEDWAQKLKWHRLESNKTQAATCRVGQMIMFPEAGYDVGKTVTTQEVP